MRRSWIARVLDIGVANIGVLAAFAVVVFGWANAAQAQGDFPTKPVTLVVSLAAGGPSDTVTRILADELSKVWKQQVVVENKPGGGTTIATQYVLNAKPDGYMMLVVSGSFTILPGVRSHLPYDPVKDFSGITVFLEGPHALVANPSFPPNSIPELIAESKKRGDQLITFSGAGTASTGHMLGELIQKRTGIKMKHIAYSGEAAAIPDLLAGRIDFSISTWANVRPLVQSKKLKLIAALNPTRLPDAPDVQTLNEAIPGLDSALGAFNAVVVPSGVPADVKAKIAAGMKQATESKVYKDRITALGSYPRSKTPEETDAYLKKAMSTWGEVAKSANIRIE